MRVASWIPAVALAVLAALPGAAEDLTIVVKETHGSNAPVTSTSYISADKLRTTNAEGTEVLAEPAAGKFTMIDHKKKEYYVVTRQDLEAAMAEMQARMKQMEPQMKQAQEQMKNLPPELREKMAGMMGGFVAAVNVQKGTGGRTVAGHRCENWIITMGEMSRTEECLTTELQFPAQTWAAYQDFNNRMKSAMTTGPMGQAFAQMKEKFKDVKGYPLASTTTTKILGRTSASTTEVTEIKKGSIPASAWELPAGYKQVESPMAKMAKKK